MLLVSGCRSHHAPPDQPLPPNTILLSQLMRELSAQPGFTEALLRQLQGAPHAGKRGPALLTPALADDLRQRILGKDWQRLDRFPGWTMREINPTVRVAGHIAGKNSALEGEAAVHPGAPAASAAPRAFLDLGPYALDRAQTVSLDEPSTLPGFTTQGIVTELGDGVERGDGPNQLAPEHAESQRLADVLNRLAANNLDNVAPFKVSRPWPAVIARRLPGSAEVSKPVTFSSTPEDVIFDLIATGHHVTVIDARYFANFGHLHFSARSHNQSAEDVMMPFWINTRIAVPGTGGPFGIGARPLLVPVSHAEYEWQIRGPRINADVSYYFGIDGKSQWRVMDTLDQAWVLKRAAHTYTGAPAVEITRFAGLLTVAYMHQHQARPHLPFGGYYALGVCQDGISAIERRMTGSVTLFPNTADTSLFKDPRDAEVNAMLEAIPKDRGGAAPPPERIFGSLPTAAAPDGNFSAVTIPGLAADLSATYIAWRHGGLHRTHRAWPFLLGALAIAGAVATLGISRRQQRR